MAADRPTASSTAGLVDHIGPPEAGQVAGGTSPGVALVTQPAMAGSIVW